MDENLRKPYQGHLIKFTNVVKGWQSRWFVLDPEHGTLQYYLSEGDKNEKARGGMHLAGAVISPSYEDSLTFTVSPADGESYKLRAHDTKDRQMWINRLRIIAEMHTRAIGHHHPPLAPREHRSKGSAAATWQPTTFGGLDVLDAFTQVAEILDETQRQHSALAQSIEELPSHGPGLRSLEPNVLLIKATSQATIACLDQCLCALRSQHTTLRHSSHAVSHTVTTFQSRGLASLSPLVSPIMGRSPRSLRGNTASSLRRRSQSPNPPGLASLSPLVSPIMGRSPRSLRGNTASSLRRRSQSPNPPLFSGSPSHQQSLPSVKSRTAPQSPTPSSLVPSHISQQASSSSVSSIADVNNSEPSEGKSFSNEQSFQLVVKKSASTVTSKDASDLHSENGSSISALENLGQDADSNSDSEISDTTEVDQSAENGDTVEEGQRSVLMHIISQLRLGMDLTRVTLPTFILEKRSLLEMFADFLGHPELFLKIANCSTPEERIIAIVRWYLTSIHVGRHGSVAKKPYNPIIGETFFCSWRVPASSVEETKQYHSSNKYYTIRYRSEQVSHHPPVSAFYIDCPELQMCINAHIWTKSKFMGMSVGVNLIGNITLVLGKFSESYHLAMPSAYARSVLMEPWVELGGRINIHCPQTGHSAPIVFHTKPFYGGRLHKVTCEVKTSSGGYICKVQGEWDSFLEFTYEDERIDEVINVKELGLICHKRVRPVTRQASNESRHLWYNVTKALTVGDLVTATNHKKELEDRQRAEEQQRAATKTQFPTKLFHSVGSDQWIYNYLPQYAENFITVGGQPGATS